jgi:hypothetical protein
MTECIHCGEPVLDHEPHDQYANGPIAHRPCFMRALIGSLAHQQQQCSCYVLGSECGDPSDMTRRQAAEAAYKYWLMHNQ